MLKYINFLLANSFTSDHLKTDMTHHMGDSDMMIMMYFMSSKKKMNGLNDSIWNLSERIYVRKQQMGKISPNMTLNALSDDNFPFQQRGVIRKEKLAKVQQRRGKVKWHKVKHSEKF